MAASNDPIPEAPLFSATITPHRSLGRKGFIAVMCAIGGVSFIAGVVFLIAGAWPVFGFFGLDVLAIWWAFRLNFRSAKACEEITVTHSELRVRRTSHRGHVVEWVLNPLWVRLDVQESDEFGVERLALVSRGRSLGIASFLGPDEKRSFYNALSGALASARRGVDYNPAR